MGDKPRAERVVEWLQGFLLQVKVSQIIVHEAGEPNAVVDLLDAEFLAGRDGGDVDALPAQAKTPLRGHKNSRSWNG